MHRRSDDAQSDLLAMGCHGNGIAEKEPRLAMKLESRMINVGRCAHTITHDDARERAEMIRDSHRGRATFNFPNVESGQ